MWSRYRLLKCKNRTYNFSERDFITVFPCVTVKTSHTSFATVKPPIREEHRLSTNATVGITLINWSKLRCSAVFRDSEFYLRLQYAIGLKTPILFVKEEAYIW